MSRKITIVEQINLTDEEIRVLRQLSKKGRSFLKSRDDESINSLAKKDLIEVFYYINAVDTGHYWRLTKKGRLVLKQV